MVDPRELRPEIKTPHAYADIARFSSAAENLGAAENSTHSSMLSSRRWPADEARGTPNRGSQSKGDANNSNQASPGAFLSANNNLEGRINVSKTEISGLDMSNSGIKWLTPTISRFTYLTELRLGGNMLKRLPSGISCLRNLCFLDLSNNQLQQISSEIGWLSCLRELLLFNNEIVDLPPELGYLYQLENLGIDGNPINDDLLAIAHNQGPLSIITFLRDHVINVNPPPDRVWHTLEQSAYESRAHTTHTMSIMCYNILCEKYATPQMFGYVPSWYLSWEYRKQVILHEILSYDAELVCLQEVESSQYEQYFKPQLRMRGSYDSFFFPKSRAKTMNEWDRSFVDGCAMFFKADKFRLEEKMAVEFNQLALSRPLLRKHKDMYNRVMTRDNISVIARFEHRDSRQEIIVGNAHIHWDPAYRDVKLIQTIMLVEEIEKMSLLHQKAAVVVCGDFNSLPGSGVFNFLETGSVPGNHPDFMGFTYEPYTTDGCHHSLALRNTYANSDLTFTSMTAMFMGVIDYIWYKQGAGLTLRGYLGSVSGDYVKQIVGLPSQSMPSDHVSLVVEFGVYKR